jgi:hypothetical protein
MFGLYKKSSGFIFNKAIKFAPAAFKFTLNSAAYMSTKAVHKVTDIIVKIYAFENIDMPYIGATGSEITYKISNSLDGVDLSKIFFPLILNIKDAVQGSLVQGAYFSSSPGIYYLKSINEVNSLVNLVNMNSVSLPIMNHQITSIIIKLYMIKGTDIFCRGEPGSEQTIWINTNICGIDLKEMWAPVILGVGNAMKNCLVDGACFSSALGTFSPEDENALASLVGQDAADAGIF